MRNLESSHLVSSHWLILFLFLSLISVGCSDDDSAGSDGQTSPDVGLTDGLILPSIADSSFGGSDVNLDRADYLEPCEDNEDCRSGWCVASAAGDVCSRICFE